MNNQNQEIKIEGSKKIIKPKIVELIIGEPKYRRKTIKGLKIKELK